jgi:L-ascorbate metabolism protein UlaG (beta-lactamase superfamily)
VNLVTAWCLRWWAAQYPPEESDTAVFRWLGNANYEIAYKGKVYLLDTYYDRKARSRPLGFTVPQVKRADLILVGPRSL